MYLLICYQRLEAKLLQLKKAKPRTGPAQPLSPQTSNSVTSDSAADPSAAS